MNRRQEMAQARRAQREQRAAAPKQPRITRLAPGQHLETRGVLAGAYRGRGLAEDRETLTHAVLVEGVRPGNDVRTLCSQPVDNMADTFSVYPDHQIDEPPTCPICLPRWERLQEFQSGFGVSGNAIQRGSKCGMKSNGNTKASDRIRLSNGQVMTLGEALDAGLLYLRAVDNPPYKNKKYVARENETDQYWVIGQKLYESRGGDSAPRASHPRAQFLRKFGVCDFCREDLDSPTRRKRSIASFIAYDRPQNICGGCGDVPSETITVDLDARDVVDQQLMKPNAKKLYTNGPMTFEQAKAQRDLIERESKHWSDILNSFPKGKMGMVDEASRATHEYRNAKANFDRQFRALQDFNAWFVKAFKRELDEERRARRAGKLTPNSEDRHYVWVIGSNGMPLDEGPYGPFDLLQAKDMARIGATEGSHDRAVSVGRDPQASSFNIIRQYQAGTGERVL